MQQSLSNLKISVQQRAGGFSTEIYAYDERGNVAIFYSMDPEGRMVEQEVNMNEVHENGHIKPLLVFPYAMYQRFVRGLAAVDSGFKTKNETALEGKMKAKEEHLTDIKETNAKLFGIVEKLIGGI